MELNLEIKERLDEAISHLVSIGMIDGAKPVSSIANRTNRNSGNVSCALKGDTRYLTTRFIRLFCAKYNNIISPEWLLTGEGAMLSPIIGGGTIQGFDDGLESMTKEDLVVLVKSLIDIYHQQTEIYKSIIQQSNEIIQSGQEQFNNITKLIINHSNQQL